MSTKLKPAALTTWTKNFEQECDTCDDRGDTMQDLKVVQEDGGGGPYWVIQTDRWAFNDLNELIETLRQAGVPDSVPQETT